MALPRFFRTPKPQGFGYTPRFYDPAKEELEERLKRARNQDSKDTEAIKSRISRGFRERGRTGRMSRSKSTTRSNLMLVAIIIILVFFSYLILMEYTPRILEFVE